MRKKLNHFGIVLIVLSIFTGCQKNEDDEFSVNPNDEKVAQLIDNEKAQQILNNELPKLNTNVINNSTLGLKQAGNFFAINVTYSPQGGPRAAQIDVIGWSHIVGSSGDNIITAMYLYKGGKWTLQRYLYGDIVPNKLISRFNIVDYFNNEFIAIQLLIYRYRDGEQPVFTGITQGCGYFLEK